MRPKGKCQVGNFRGPYRLQHGWACAGCRMLAAKVMEMRGQDKAAELESAVVELARLLRAKDEALGRMRARLLRCEADIGEGRQWVECMERALAGARGQALELSIAEINKHRYPGPAATALRKMLEAERARSEPVAAD